MNLAVRRPAEPVNRRPIQRAPARGYTLRPEQLGHAILDLTPALSFAPSEYRTHTEPKTEPYYSVARIHDVRILPFLLGLEPTPSVVFQCGRRCAFLACNERRPSPPAQLTSMKVPGQEPERISADVSWAM